MGAFNRDSRKLPKTASMHVRRLMQSFSSWRGKSIVRIEIVIVSASQKVTTKEDVTLRISMCTTPTK